MHIQVVHFQLSGIGEAEFRAQCDELAPAFAALTGLISKVWLADPAMGTYGASTPGKIGPRWSATSKATSSRPSGGTRIWLA